ncbi:MAG: hypothetical protein WD398_15905 [Cyclobacteriaceae bacterium]
MKHKLKGYEKPNKESVPLSLNISLPTPPSFFSIKNIMKHGQFLWCILPLCCLFLTASCSLKENQEEEQQTGVRPWSENPSYWEYDGLPVLLLGATDNDNLFQTNNLKSHLDSLAEIGGNYVRNTMSDRDENDLKAFYKNEAFLAAKAGENYLVYFPGEGEVKLDLSPYPQAFEVSWITLEKAEWENGIEMEGGNMVSLSPPVETGSLALIQVK